MYDELFEVWKKEVENPELQSLPKDFYTRLSNYVKKLNEEKRMIDEKSIRGKLLLKEEENVKKMISDLIHIRYRKIMMMAAKKESIPLTSLTSEEENLYDGLLLQAEACEEMLENILHGQKPRIERILKNRGFMVVRILKEIPSQIKGTDMKNYGPFKPEDIVMLPEENAKALIKRGAAEKIEVQ